MKKNFNKRAGCFEKGGLSFCYSKFRSERGNVLFYIFMAVGLLSALTFAFVGDSRDDTMAQNAHRITETLFMQVQTIKSAVLECTLEYPAGGGDLDGDTDIDAVDNPNRPYPLSPTSVNNPGGAAADDNARNMKCPGSSAVIFSGAGTTGKFLPPARNGMGEWKYYNDANGVYIQVIGGSDGGTVSALSRLAGKFDTCEADINYGACGTNCFTGWLVRTTCP